MKNIFPYLLLLLIFASCKQVVDFYFGVPLQPVIEKNSFVPGLNIFGIIRPDSTQNFNNSFVQVQKVVPAVGSSDSMQIDSAGVFIYNTEQTNAFSCQFVSSNYTGTFEQTQYRSSCPFSPKAGETYFIECNYRDLPVLVAQTIVPEKASLITSSIYNSYQKLAFELQKDSSIYMVDVYVFSNHELINYQRVSASQTENTRINFGATDNLADSIVVFSYDYNFAKYYLTSNISLNFNKYRESFSTVQNGFGVFGSMNKNSFILNK